MPNGVANSAIGAILEIPAQALTNIKKAEDAIRRLGKTSWETANSVRTHWGYTATQGLDLFIKKLREAREVMNGLGTVNVTLNTTAAVQSGQQLSDQMHKTAMDTSKAAQDMASSMETIFGSRFKFLSKDLLDAESFNSVVKLKEELAKVEKMRDSLSTGQSGSGKDFGLLRGGEYDRQMLADYAKELKFVIEYWRECSKAKEKALTKVQSDYENKVLAEQSRLLADSIKYQKELNALRSNLDQKSRRGIAPTSEERQHLADLESRLKNIGNAYASLGVEYAKLSEKGREAWDTRYVDAMMEKRKANITLTDKEAAALERINKANQKQANKSYLDEEGRLLARILDLRKQISASSAKVASGRLTQASDLPQRESDLRNLQKALSDTKQAYAELTKTERGNLDAAGLATSRVNLEKYKNEVIKQSIKLRQDENKEIGKAQELSALAQSRKPRIGNSDEGRIQRQLNSDYKEMIKVLRDAGEIKAKAAEQGRTLTQSEIDLIVTLRQRYNIFRDDIKRVSNEYATLAENARRMFEQDKSEVAKRNMVAYEDAVRKASVVAQKEADAVNRNLEQRIALQQKITGLETKHAIAGVKDPTATMSFADETRLSAYNEQMRKLDAKLNELAQKYPQLARAANQAFDAEKINLLTVALQKLGEAQAKNKANQDSANAQNAENRLNELYSQRLQLLKEKEQLENKALLNTARGQQNALTAKENQLLAELNGKLTANQRAIDGIAQSYAGLEAKTRMAFNSEKLRQDIQLQNQFNKAVDSIDSSKAKALVAEYKRLYAENQRIFEAMGRFVNNGGNPIAAQTSTAPQDVAYQQIAQRHWDILDRMREIERQNIQEVADFRVQKEMEANQKTISDFIQAEAQKKAAAQQASQEQAEVQKRNLQDYLQSYQGAMWQARQVLKNAGGSDMLVTNLENVKRAIADLKTASGKMNLLNPKDAENAEKLKKKIGELEALLKRYKAAATPDKPAINPQDAINAATNASTLRQLEQAYKNLKEVMANTKTSDPMWAQMNAQMQLTKRNIDDIKRKMGELNTETQRTSGFMGQLQSRIAAAFSAAGIMNFTKKIVEVRAQFELQRVALGAIIQDKDLANKTFLQVQQMALESPFSIMQLERATKQIAAFGFESKKLVPTMKMFADLGAGLGVELERITLVMGHLRARGYLEGTMVRQFTNMGFNVLGELAKYYTELEGKMVSVADVQTRVKKKMVEFGDVEEVLKRVTSAGGMFYDMQKKQSDSIWGQMQRITDAYDLMLNEIGQKNESSIKTGLTFIRDLINSWRTLLPVIETIGAAMVAYFLRVNFTSAITGLGKLTMGFRYLGAMITKAAAAQRLLNSAQMVSGWGTLLGIIAAVGVAIYEVITYQSKLNEELERTQKEGISDMYGLIFQYRELADTVKDSTKPYEDRKKALDELNRVYKDILPDEMLEIENIRKMSDGYKEATDAIKAYSEAKIRKNMQDTIETEYGKQIQEAIKNNSEEFTREAFGLFGSLDVLEDIDEKTFNAAVSNIMLGISEEIKTGELAIEEAAGEFRKRFMAAMGLSDADVKRLAESTGKDIERIFRDAFSDKYTGNLFGFKSSGLETVIKEMEEDVGRISSLGLTSDIFEMKSAPAVKQYENLEKAVSGYTTALENLYNRKAELEKQGGEFGTIGIGTVTNAKGEQYESFTFPGVDEATQSALDAVYKKLADLQGKVSDYGQNFAFSTNDINAALQSNIDKMEYMGRVTENSLESVLDNFSKWGGALVNNPFMKNFVESALKNINLLTEPQRKIMDIGRKVAAANGVTLNTFDMMKIAAATTYTDAAKEAKKLSDAAQDNIKQIAATRTQLLSLAKATGQVMTIAQAQAQAESMHGGKTEKELKKEAAAWEQYWKALGGYEKSSKNKSKGSKSDKELKRWQDLVKAIEDVSTAYDKARKSFTVDESNRQIENLFGSTFKELNADIKQFYKDGTYDTESLIDALEVLLGMTKATTEERKKFRSEVQRKIADTQVEIDVKLREDSENKIKADLDKMFDNYELSKTFKGLGLNVDLVYMLGGHPVSLGDMRATLAKMREDAGGKKAAENLVKIFDDVDKKISDKEAKFAEERAKNYYKYLLESMSERTQIELKAMNDINKIRDDATLDEETKRRASEERIKKMRVDLDKQAWKEFQGTDSYIRMFEDMENASSFAITRMLNKLNSLRGSLKNLPADQVKAIVREMDKLKDAAIDRNPFKGFAENLKKTIEYLRERKDIEERIAGLEADENAVKDSINTQEKLVHELQLQYDAMKAMEDISDKDKKTLKDQLDLEKAKLKAAKEQLKVILKMKETEEDRNKQGEDAEDGLEKAFSKIQSYARETLGYVEGIMEALDKMGVLSETDKDNFESFKEAFEALNNIAEGGIKVITNWGKNWAEVVNGTIQGVMGTIQMVAMAFSVGDKKKERRIKALADRVYLLDRAYQRLEKTMESVYTFDDYNAGYNKAVKNLELQKKAYQEMLELELAKKKTDDEKVREYREKLEELADQEEELRKKRIEDMGSTTDYLSQAESFVNAWLEAYREVGDGADALKKSLDEFMDSFVVKQAAAQLVSTRLRKVIDMINTGIDNGATGLALSDIVKNATDEWKAGSEVLNQALKEFFTAMGVDIGSAGDLALSDLQKGVQNNTEPQAAAIEAYLNSMRFAVFRHTEQLDALIAIVSAQLTSVESPVVNELRGIRRVLDSIDSRLNSVIGNHGGYGMGIRVLA